jgi:hypothetical protein
VQVLWEVVRSLLRWLIHLPGRATHWLATAPGRFARWWRRERHERWGYIWWGLSGVVIAVPEIWAAVGGDDVLWPTISGTIGNLEVFHQWVALIVVAVLVWAAFHAISVTREQLRGADGKDGRRLVAGDRFTVASETNEIGHPLVYLFFAVGAVALPSVLFRELYHGADHRYVFGEVMYASIAFWWMIVPGWLAYKRGWLVPFPTLFRTQGSRGPRAPVHDRPRGGARHPDGAPDPVPVAGHDPGHEPAAPQLRVPPDRDGQAPQPEEAEGVRGARQG